MLDAFLQWYTHVESGKLPSEDGGARFRAAVLAQCIAAEDEGADTLALLEACLEGRPPPTEAERKIYDLALDLDRAAMRALLAGEGDEAYKEVERLLGSINSKPRRTYG